MRFVQPSAAKLNLSLRVTGKREDGYHDIVSLFLRLDAAETLLISEARGGEDSVRARGVEITGENIVSRALRRAREEGLNAPPLDVEIVKNLQPGSGLGAGSGNGAAALRWLSENSQSGNDLAWRNAALKTGADVPFLFSGFPLALVSGVGEVIEPLEPLNFFARVVFPDWSVGTENAYAQLDHWYGGAYPLDGLAAREEAAGLFRRLKNKERTGLLPNDFAPELMEKFPHYDELFGLFERSAACAWGITGSGSAAFALFCGAAAPLAIRWPVWVRQVLSAETGK